MESRRFEGILQMLLVDCMKEMIYEIRSYQRVNDRRRYAVDILGDI